MNRASAAQALWRRLAPGPLRRAAAPALAAAARAYVHAAPRRPAIGETGLPIKVVGAFSAGHGIAASARLCLRALQALGAEAEPVEAAVLGFDLRRRLAGPTAPAIWIFHVNPPELVATLASLGPERLVGPRYGYWAWELPRAPRRWLADAALLDEVWTPSRYTAEALGGAAAPVRVVPHPLFMDDYAQVAPAPREAGFEAVALVDFNSSLARKNPQGAVAAFRAAFGEDPRRRLTLKTQNGDRFPELLSALQAQAGGNVRLIDETWPYERVKSLIAGADALVSLHRAEGFGLTLAEALAMGVPVVATAYSGPMDFLDQDCALLTPYRLVEARDPQGLYSGQTWAEPDVEAAAGSLKRLANDPGLRARLAEAGRARVRERLSPTAWLATLPPGVQAAAGLSSGSPRALRS